MAEQQYDEQPPVPSGPAPAPSGVAILGAGPIGLDAALAAAEAGWPFTVYEAAPTVAGNVRQWGHVRLFTPWTMNVSDRMARQLTATGCPVPTGPDCPTGHELVTDLLQPLAKSPALAGHVRYGAQVLAIGRSGLLKHEEIGTDQRAAAPFRLVVRGVDGSTEVTTASLVLDCTGTYGNPNSAGDGGIAAPGEEALGERIVRSVPDLNRDRDSWAGHSVLLLGAGKSAQTAARDLAALAASAPGTRVVWAVRSVEPDWSEVTDDSLAQRQALVDSSRRAATGALPGIQVIPGVAVDGFSTDGGQVVVRLAGADKKEVRVDKVLSLTGYVPDASIYRQLQVHECYATAAPIELSAQLLGDAAGDCLTSQSYGVDILRSPEPNFFLLGAKSYGRNSQFLLRTGYEQVGEVAGAYLPAAR